MRSRAVSLPCSFCLASRSGPPPWRSCSFFLRRASIRSSILLLSALIATLSWFRSRGLDGHLVRFVTDFDLVGDGRRDGHPPVGGLAGRGRGLGGLRRLADVLRPL